MDKRTIIIMISAFSILATAVAIFSCESDAETTSSTGSEISWSYDEVTKTISFKGDGNGVIEDYDLKHDDPSTAIIPPWYNHKEEAEHATFEGVKRIGNQTLRDFTSLESVDLKDVGEIGNRAFENCSKLGGVHFYNVISIGNKAFMGTGLTEVFLPNSLTSLGKRVFESCESLRLVKFGANITNIENTLSESKIRIVDISDVSNLSVSNNNFVAGQVVFYSGVTVPDRSSATFVNLDGGKIQQYDTQNPVNCIPVKEGNKFEGWYCGSERVEAFETGGRYEAKWSNVVVSEYGWSEEGDKIIQTKDGKYNGGVSMKIEGSEEDGSYIANGRVKSISLQFEGESFIKPIALKMNDKESSNSVLTIYDVGTYKIEMTCGDVTVSKTIVVVEEPEEPTIPLIPTIPDDDELPFIPPQSGGDDGADTTTYVAVAAAAAVVAILAVLAVGISKGKL